MPSDPFLVGPSVETAHWLPMTPKDFGHFTFPPPLPVPSKVCGQSSLVQRDCLDLGAGLWPETTGLIGEWHW